jgi:hypothetical protein
MPSAKQHYDQVLSDIYSWMLGGFESGVERNLAFFRKHGIEPRGSGTAFDLGAGCGFQSIPLAGLGFAVTAVDFDGKLLSELVAHMGEHAISTIEDDLLNFDDYTEVPLELIVCMTDTLLHLESQSEVRKLFGKAQAALEANGRFVLTFRDLTNELTDLDRFIPVRSDDATILTCVLEYEPHSVKVHDLVYRREAEGWRFSKSYYRKLRLSPKWVSDELAACGFEHVDMDAAQGVVTAVATK